jgi:3',5'-cyclic AMP phosphodiesterase CpdA
MPGAARCARVRPGAERARAPDVVRRLASTVVVGALLTVACGDVQPPGARRPPVVEEAPRPIPEGLTLPNALTSVKFAVIGDSGRGTPEQHAVADQMVRARETFKFAFVLMLGDNIYEGPATPDDYRLKFEEPYDALLRAGVRFFASLGNHDDPRQIDYPPFNMDGERYYSFAPPEDPLTRLTTRVEFFALDSTNLDGAQIRWLDQRLEASGAHWKVVFLHHPLYSSGRYRNTARAHRLALEPVFRRRGVSAVFSGHEHIYQRSHPQNGIQYFISGGAGSLRRGDGATAPYVARSYSDDYHFMLVEIARDALHFQAIGRRGQTVDAGTLYQDARAAAASAAGTAGRR